MPEERDLLQSAVNLINGALDHPEFDAEIKHGEVSAGALARMARDVASVVSVLQAEEHLELARQSRDVQDQQLELQKTVGFPGLAGCMDLVARIAATERGGWNAGMVNGWITEAQALDAP